MIHGFKLVLLLAVCLFAGLLTKTAFAQAKRHAEKPEVRRWLPLTKFYDAPQPLPPGKPGDLIRSEDAEDYALAPGVNALRILYHTRSAGGEDVASSGLILYPDQKPPAGGWPVIAWAHSAGSVARQCAPSLSRILPHTPLLTMYVNLGYAVVATDYAGLGTHFRYAFSDMNSNATDVINSIPAARAALPQLAKQWIAIGADSGGRTIVAIAEREHEIHDPSFLGGIAMGGLYSLDAQYQHSAGSEPLFLAHGVMTVYPQFEPSEVLTESGVVQYRQAETTCEHAPPSQAPLLKPHWPGNKFVKDFFARNSPGQKPLSAPLLLLVAEPDPARAAESTKTVRHLCQQGAAVQFEQYEETDPGNLIGDSVSDQMAWIQGRLAGRAAPSNCSDLR